MKSSSADIKVRQEREGKHVPGAEIPLKPVDDHAEAYNPTAAHKEDPVLEKVDIP